jgi:hypothetical protein
MLADEEMSRAMEQQAALLLRRLGWYEPHVGPDDRLADGGAVHSIKSGVFSTPLQARQFDVEMADELGQYELPIE